MSGISKELSRPLLSPDGESSFSEAELPKRAGSATVRPASAAGPVPVSFSTHTPTHTHAPSHLFGSGLGGVPSGSGDGRGNYVALEASAPSTSGARAPPPPRRAGPEEEAAIDSGFETHTPFDRGHVELRQGQAGITLAAAQPPLSVASRLCSGLSVALLSCSIVGLPYVLAKLTLVRRGEIGLVEWWGGNVRVLEPGVHILETMNTTVTKASLQSDIIAAGALKIIRVQPGFYGLATENGRGVVLSAGLHVSTDPLFNFHRVVPMVEPHITIATVHIITVAVGQVGLCTVGQTAHFLESGRHMINHDRFTFKGFASLTQEHIAVGSKHRVQIQAGKLGLAFENGEPIILEPSRTYYIDSPTFRFVGTKDSTDPVISHGRLKIIMVREGSWGVSYDDGKLAILQPGRHILSKPTHYFAGFLSAGQSVLMISEVTSMTADHIPVKFDAAISIKVVQPELAITSLCSTVDEASAFSFKKLEATLISRAKLTLAMIIGNNPLTSMQRSTTKAAHTQGTEARSAGAAAAPEDPSAAESSDGFKRHVHDLFMGAFTAALAESGVLCLDMSIEDVTVVNADLAKVIAQGAVARAGLAKAHIDQEVTRTQALAASEAEVLRAEGAARALRLQTAAQAEKTNVEAEAEARKIRMLAEADAARIKTLDAAIASATSLTQQRELVIAAGSILSNTKTSLLVAPSTMDVTRLLGAGSGGPLSGAFTAQ